MATTASQVPVIVSLLRQPGATSPFEQGPLQRVTLREQAVARLRQLILTGGLPVGQSFAEAVLANMLGISRTPVREAVQQLTNEGLLDAAGSSGVRIHVVTEAEQEEIFLLRRALEVLAVRRLAGTATKEQIEALRSTLARQAALAEHDEERWAFLELDQTYHLQLAEFAGLALTQKLLRDIRNLFYLMGLSAVNVRGRAQAVLVEHRRILDAVARHDPDAAAAALAHHLDDTQQVIAKSGVRPGAPAPEQAAQRASERGRGGHSTGRSRRRR